MTPSGQTFEVTGRLLFEPEVIADRPAPRVYVFVSTDEGPQEILCEGASGLTAAKLPRGELVTVTCETDGALWRATKLEKIEREPRLVEI